MAPLVMANSQLFDEIKAFKQVKIRNEEKVKTILQTMLAGGNEQIQVRRSRIHLVCYQKELLLGLLRDSHSKLLPHS